MTDVNGFLERGMHDASCVSQINSINAIGCILIHDGSLLCVRGRTDGRAHEANVRTPVGCFALFVRCQTRGGGYRAGFCFDREVAAMRFYVTNK